MRGRRASFATTDRTWWSLNTLQEQTIIALLLTSESHEGRGGEDQHKGAAPSRHKPEETIAGHVCVACAPGGGRQDGHRIEKRLRGWTAVHCGLPGRVVVATTTRRKINEPSPG